MTCIDYDSVFGIAVVTVVVEQLVHQIRLLAVDAVADGFVDDLQDYGYGQIVGVRHSHYLRYKNLSKRHIPENFSKHLKKL